MSLFDSDPNTVYCKEDGTDYPGSDVGSIPNVADSYKCQDECRANSECNFWTFNTYDNYCWLKSQTTNSLKLCYTISGPKYCPSIESSTAITSTVTTSPSTTMPNGM